LNNNKIEKDKTPASNKNYMSIAVSVLTTSQVARNSGGAARQESNPQSATAYSSVRYQTCKKKKKATDMDTS
jgi:hypothetical protein